MNSLNIINCGVNSACKARIIIGFRQPRTTENFYRQHLQDPKLYQYLNKNTVRSSVMQGVPQNPNHKIELIQGQLEVL